MASDQQVQGLRARLVIDRDTASRLGITPATIDQTLYDAYGQRQVSTMFTQLNQYHVVLEVQPAFQQNPADLRNLYIRTGTGSSATAAGLVAGGSSTAAVAQGPVNTIGRHRRGQRRQCRPRHTRIRRRAIASSTVFPTGGQVPLSAFTHVETDQPSPSPSTTRASSRW